MGDERILIVRQGPGRGRLDSYLQHVFDHYSVANPGLRERIVVHETGDEKPSLDGFTAVVFWMGDPLRRMYPACFEEASEIAGEARRLGLRLINPPDVLADYSKSHQIRKWSEAGISTPAGTRYADHGEFQELVSRLDYPVIVRGDEVHKQDGILILDSASDAAGVGEGMLPSPGVVCPLVDVRSGYRKKSPLSMWARFYHLKRVFVIGDTVLPDRLRFSSEPIVATHNSIFARYAARCREIRLTVPAGHRRGMILRGLGMSPTLRRSLALEQEFMNREVEGAEVFLSAARTLGLEFLAIDYATPSKGEIVLWEANPFPNIRAGDAYLLADQRRTHEMMQRFYDALAAFFEELLEHTVSKRVTPRAAPASA